MIYLYIFIFIYLFIYFLLRPSANYGGVKHRQFHGGFALGYLPWAVRRARSDYCEIAFDLLELSLAVCVSWQ